MKLWKLHYHNKKQFVWNAVLSLMLCITTAFLIEITDKNNFLLKGEYISALIWFVICSIVVFQISPIIVKKMIE